MYISGERKALGTFTFRLSHVSVDVKVRSVSQTVRVSVDVCVDIGRITHSHGSARVF